MLEILFNRPKILDKYRKAPFLEAREQFLEQCAENGYSSSMLKKIAWVQYSVAPCIDLYNGKLKLLDIELAIDRCCRLDDSKKQSRNVPGSRQLFIHITTDWLRSLDCFEDLRQVDGPFQSYISAFAKHLGEERGLSPITIATRCERLGWFFNSLPPSQDSLSAISITDVEAFIEEKSRHGWKRSSLSSLAGSLRSFFYYAERMGWCSPGIAAVIETPRIYALEGLPKGPAWEDVQRLLASTRGNRPADIRAYAILMLLTVYGLRRSEVAQLQLNDLDWGGEKIIVKRPKQRRTQWYPLLSEVGEAILRYLQEVRPRSEHRALFLTLAAPIRPLASESISPIVRSRLRALRVDLPHYGAHCLRHACAGHLLASGFSLKEIGDHLGHRTANATLNYTKVHLASLREVAELDLRRLL